MTVLYCYSAAVVDPGEEVPIRNVASPQSTLYNVLVIVSGNLNSFLAELHITLFAYHTYLFVPTSHP